MQQLSENIENVAGNKEDAKSEQEETSLTENLENLSLSQNAISPMYTTDVAIHLAPPMEVVEDDLDLKTEESEMELYPRQTCVRNRLIDVPDFMERNW